MMNKAASEFEDMFCSFNQLMKGLILSGETVSVHDSTNYIWDRMEKSKRRIHRFPCNHNNKKI